MRRCLNLTLALTLTAAILAGCGSSTPNNPSESATGTTAQPTNVSLNKDDYPVFPNADAGADAAVSAEQGGKGFTGEGWQTNTSYDLIGDPRAVKGGTFREGTPDFPTTLRFLGPNTSAWNSMVSSMVYETLLNLHPTTLEYIPALATHWKVSPDQRTFWFRINPNARFSDGQPVTSEDVVTSLKFHLDKGLQDPMLLVVYTKYSPPVAESKYIVRVTTNTDSWRNFLYFAASTTIFPAHVLKNLDGATYIRDYNYKLIPGSGPYTILEQNVNKGNSIKITRRKDYWAENERRNIGTNNFDEIQEIVVRDRNLEFEMFKKGDLDYYYINRPEMWFEQLNYDNMKRGLNQKRKVFNHNPNGMVGMPINTRREPFNDIRVRKALRLLLDRETIISKLMYSDMNPIDSSFPGSVYENPNNEKIKYDPKAALALLAEAGWKDRDSSGRLVKNGRPLTVELAYYDKTRERYLTIYQEDLRKVGISLNLRLITFETMLKLTDERTFDLVYMGYTGLAFPNPETQLQSSLADQKNNNNLTGFKNQRVDEIIKAYDTAFEQSKRVTLLRELDGIFTNAHHWIFSWYPPSQKIVYWNKFGIPRGILTRLGDYRDIPSLWWNDPEKAQKLEQARRDTSIQLGEGPSEDKYWLEFDKIEEKRDSLESRAQ